jgi:hypothetical protein
MLEYDDMSQVETLVESLEHLPIASRSSPRLRSGLVILKTTMRQSRQLEPSRTRCARLWEDTESFVSLSRSHQSLRLPPRTNRNAVYLLHTRVPGLLWTPRLQKGSRSRPQVYLYPTQGTRDATEVQGKLHQSRLDRYGGVAPHQLPDDLRLCLEGIEGILAEHLKLAKALRKRYDEQYPLVRSLTDIFLANVRYLILLSYCPDHRLTLALVTHPPGLYGLCSASRTGPRASQRRYFNKHFQPNAQK